MILGGNTLGGSSLGGTVGGAGVPIPPQPVIEAGFHAALADWLYPATIERERRVIFGDDATCTMYAVSPGAGEEEVEMLTTGWMARRIPTIESGADEQWRLEIVSDQVSWGALRFVSTVRLKGATNEVQHYKVLQAENAMKPGRIYHLRMVAIDQRPN